MAGGNNNETNTGCGAGAGQGYIEISFWTPGARIGLTIIFLHDTLSS